MAEKVVAKDYHDLSLEDFMSFELRTQALIVRNMQIQHRKDLEDEALTLVNYYGGALLNPGAPIADASGYISEPNTYTMWKKYLSVYTLLSGWFLEDELRAKEELRDQELALQGEG